MKKKGQAASRIGMTRRDTPWARKGRNGHIVSERKDAAHTKV